MPRTLAPRAPDDSPQCTNPSPDQITISRPTLIALLTTTSLLTLLSLTLLGLLAHRAWLRRREAARARKLGRASTYQRRISALRKEVDAEYLRQFRGCLVVEPENPFLKVGSPVELGMEERVVEAPAGVEEGVRREEKDGKDGDDRARKGKTLLFDQARGLWFHRH